MKLTRFNTKSLVVAAALAAAIGMGGSASATNPGNVPASWLPAPLRLVGV